LTSHLEEEKVIDEWGPEKILQVYDPDTAMRGVLVIDNTSTGPGKGGIRFADTVTPLTLFWDLDARNHPNTALVI